MLNEARKAQIIAVMASLSGVYDDRLPPDTKRRGQFKAGWADVTRRGQRFSAKALSQITWNNLGYRMGDAIGYATDDEIVDAYEFLARSYRTDEEAQWLEPPEMDEDEESKGEDDGDYLALLPDEDEIDEQAIEEGRQTVVGVNRWERSLEAREACIAHYGAACQACGFDFGKAFPSLEDADGFIHVHHVVPLSNIRTNYVVDPIKDLIPLCPNCHAAAHLADPPLSLAQLKAALGR